MKIGVTAITLVLAVSVVLIASSSQSSIYSVYVVTGGRILSATYTIRTNGTHYWATRYDGRLLWLSTDASHVINSAIMNDTSIYIAEGTYNIPSHIDITEKNDILFTGSGFSTILNGTRGQHGILIRDSSNITLSNLAITNAGSNYTRWAIEIEASTDVFFDNVRSFKNFESGFRVGWNPEMVSGSANSKRIHFINCISEWSNSTGASPRYGDGFDVYHAEDVTIIGCSSRYNENVGIGIYDSVDVRVQASEIVGNCYDGIVAYNRSEVPSTNVQISGNSIHDNMRSGVVIGFGPPTDNSWAVINDNEVYSNLQRGVLLHGVNNCEISNNCIHDNGWEGIGVVRSSRNTVQGNRIYLNQRNGVWIYGDIDVSSTYNLVENNTVTNNGKYGIREGVYADYNQIIQNTALNNPSGNISTSGSHTIVRSNNTTFSIARALHYRRNPGLYDRPLS